MGKGEEWARTNFRQSDDFGSWRAYAEETPELLDVFCWVPQI